MAADTMTHSLKQSLIIHLEMSQWILQKNLSDVTHEESIRMPSPGGNCLNWVLGHILRSRHELLEVIGDVTAEEKLRLERYKRGAPPFDSNDAIPFETLLDLLLTTKDRYTHAIAGLSEERLAEKAPFSPGNNPEETIESLITKFAFHEDYHTGQTGVLRRLVGKEGMLK